MISILMASYNYELYIGEAIKSVLNQTWIDFELLVIDDGSKDGSVALARSFAEHDPRVRVLQHPDGKNHGLPETLSLGIVEAGGDWIAFLESDDLWEPECLERRMELARQTRADVVLNAIRPLPRPERVRDGLTFMSLASAEHERRSIRSGGAYSLQSSLSCGEQNPDLLLRHAQSERLRACSFAAPVPRWLDWWIWIQVAQTGLFAFVPAQLTSWRLHAGSYNHKITLKQCIQDNMRLWDGFRGLQESYRQSGKNYSYWFLQSPFWSRLLARFGMIAYQSGVFGTLKQIHNRIR